jgi:hypothetical protein
MVRILLLVVLAAGAAVLAVSHRNAEAAESRLAAVAGGIAQREVRIECQGAFGSALDVGSEAGSVEFDAFGRPSETAVLKRGVCTSLRRFARDASSTRFTCVLQDVRCPGETLRSVWAVHTLSHEAWHLAGEQSEAVTECYALQTTAWTAERLGAQPVVSDAIARYVAAHMFPELPIDYRSPACRDGGALDLRPASPLWP